MTVTVSFYRSLGWLFACLLLVALTPPAFAQTPMPDPPPPMVEQLAAVPDLDRRLADLETALNAAADQESLTATTARYILEVAREAKADPQSFDPKPIFNASRPRPTSDEPTGQGAAPPALPQGPPPFSKKYSDYVATFGITMDFGAELTRAEKLVADLKVGRDPLGEAIRDVHMAYRSELDGMLMPYRIYVPTTYNKAEKYPLIMFLHGANCDENTFMNPGLLQRAAEDRGYIVASINGRGPFSGYRKENGAEQDLFDVMAIMKQQYNIDAEHIFLTGHSMGGMGTWRIGLDYRDRFVALAPMAATRKWPGLEEKLAAGRKIPILITCGGKDDVLPPPPAIEVYRMVKELEYPTKIVVYPEDNHQEVFGSSIPEVFAWFDAYRK